MTITAYSLDIATPSGTMPVHGVHPAAKPAQAWPLVVMFMDVNGVRPELKAFAERYAREGFNVVLPDLYYRFGENISFDARTPVHERPQPEIDRLVALMTALTDDLVIEDAAALVEGLRTAGKTAEGPVGCVGYCMGGRHVLRVMCERPDLFFAGAAHFPTYAVTDQPDAPYRRLGQARGPIYIALGGSDQLMPPDHMATLRHAVEALDQDIELVVHPGAGHAYAFPERPSTYRPEAAEQDWAKSFLLFAKLRDRFAADLAGPAPSQA